jgi:Holliday junction resolvasome RuvABC ATP-dependent DNA helicase subunit
VKHNLQNLRRFLPNAKTRQISVSDVREFMEQMGIDASGLGPAERRYLVYLAETEKASLGTLALHLGLDDDFVRDQIEPSLMRLRFIQIGTGGRTLTHRGRQWASREENVSIEKEE